MAFTKVPVGMLQANAYVLFEPAQSKAIVVDPGADAQAIRVALCGRKLCGILLTHGHGDHIGAVRELREGGVPVYIHPLDAPMLEDASQSLASDMGLPPTQGPADALLEEGDLTLAGLTLQVLHTPGHTPGSICLRLGDDLFTGDTLFFAGRGRTDFPGGNETQLMASLQRLLALDPSLRVHPGHGGATTIGTERIWA